MDCAETGILQKIFSENGMENPEKEPCGFNEKCLETNVYPDVHGLIQGISVKLSQVDSDLTTEAMDQSQSILPNGETSSLVSLDFSGNDEVLSKVSDESFTAGDNIAIVKKKDDFSTQYSVKSFLHQLLLKQNGLYVCAECPFSSGHYKTFYSHCSRNHISISKAFKYVPNVAGEKTIYCCSECEFLTINSHGFKIHCSLKHVGQSLDSIMKVLPVTDPTAETAFRSYIERLKCDIKRKQASKQFEYYFGKKPTELTTSNKESVKLSNEVKFRIVKIPCMCCEAKEPFPYLLQSHYLSVHKITGPQRNIIDHHFQCEKCEFKCLNYNLLHDHFAENHDFLVVDEFNKLEVNILEVEVNGDQDGGNSPVELKMKTEKSVDSPTLSDESLHSSSDLEKDENSESLSVEAIKSANSPKQCRSIVCDKCSFVTQTIPILLYHYKTIHARNYPKFVSDKIAKDLQDNLVLINMPRSSITKQWANGWMNQSCTRLIENHSYRCRLCQFEGGNAYAINHHFSTAHPKFGCSTNNLEILEDNNLHFPTNSRCLSQKNTCFKCTICENFTSVFFQTAKNHYFEEHSTHPWLTDDQIPFLEDRIRSSTFHKCLQCQKCFKNPPELLLHLEKYHTKEVASFKMSQIAERTVYLCNGCEAVEYTMEALTMHLENHNKQNEEKYDQDYVTCYSCSKCRKVFLARRYLKHHYTRVHVEIEQYKFTFDDIPDHMITDVPVEEENKNMDSADQNNVDDDNKPQIACSTDPDFSLTNGKKAGRNGYFCSWCKHISPNSALLHVHLKRVHGRYLSKNRLEKMKRYFPLKKPNIEATKRIIYTCSHLNWQHKSPLVFSKHIETRHNIENPHKCPHCMTHFVCDTVLVMHLRKKHKSLKQTEQIIFSSPRPVFPSCTHRNIRSRSPALYKSHVAKQHSNTAPYHCPNCENAYICSNIFSLHIRKKHAMVVKSDLSEYKKAVLKENEVEAKENPPSEEMEITPTKSDEPEFKQSLPDTALLHYKPKKYCRKDGTPTKHYSHPKSVRTEPGEWRCLFCKSMFRDYAQVRKHTMKLHPTAQVARCRWCDFVCRSQVQLSNHNKIHRQFIADRMQELRAIFKEQKRKGGWSNNKKRLASEHLMQEPVKKAGKRSESSSSSRASSLESSPSPSHTQVQKARKTIRRSLSRSPDNETSTNENLSKEDDSSTFSLQNCFRLTNFGKFVCNFCGHETTDRMRVMLHVKAFHLNSSSFQCRLCFFNSACFETIRQHLVAHHKMERNYHVAIEIKATFGPKIMPEQVNPVNGLSFSPLPSLPIVKHPSKTCKKVGVKMPRTPIPMPPESLHYNPPTAIGASRSTLGSFKCPYCAIETTSTYDMEMHMKRHEVAMVDPCRFDEHSYLINQFSNLI